MSNAERRRARQFATIVDGGRVRAHHDLQPLVDLARQLDPPPVAPLPAFRAYLRDRLVIAANDLDSVEPVMVASKREPELVESRPWRELVATAAAISVMTAAGAAAASTRALPGDRLYPLKRSIESIQISLAMSEQTRGRELLERAEHRLTEAERLARAEDRDSESTRHHLDEVLGAMRADITAAADVLLKSYADEADVDALILLDQFVTAQRGRLQQLASALPASSAREVDEAADDMAALHAQIAAVTRPRSSASEDAGGSRPDRSDDEADELASGNAGGAPGRAATLPRRSDEGEEVRKERPRDDRGAQAEPPLRSGDDDKPGDEPREHVAPGSRVGVPQQAGDQPGTVARPTPDLKRNPPIFVSMPDKPWLPERPDNVPSPVPPPGSPPPSVPPALPETGAPGADSNPLANLVPGRGTPSTNTDGGTPQVAAMLPGGAMQPGPANGGGTHRGTTRPPGGTLPAAATLPGASTLPDGLDAGGTHSGGGTEPGAAPLPAGGTLPSVGTRPATTTPPVDGTLPSGGTQPGAGTHPRGTTGSGGATLPRDDGDRGDGVSGGVLLADAGLSGGAGSARAGGDGIGVDSPVAANQPAIRFAPAPTQPPPAVEHRDAAARSTTDLGVLTDH